MEIVEKADFDTFLEACEIDDDEWDIDVWSEFSDLLSWSFDATLAVQKYDSRLADVLKTLYAIHRTFMDESKNTKEGIKAWKLKFHKHFFKLDNQFFISLTNFKNFTAPTHHLLFASVICDRDSCKYFHLDNLKSYLKYLVKEYFPELTDLQQANTDQCWALGSKIGQNRPKDDPKMILNGKKCSLMSNIDEK